VSSVKGLQDRVKSLVKSVSESVLGTLHRVLWNKDGHALAALKVPDVVEINL
jgi:hypothetical protein